MLRHLTSSVCLTGESQDAVNPLRGVGEPSALLKKGKHFLKLEKETVTSSNCMCDSNER